MAKTAMKDKKMNQRIHAKRRFKERLGIELSGKEAKHIREKIWNNEAELVYKPSIRVSIWDVEFENRVIRVVFDKKRKNIVTVLPPSDNDNDKEEEE